MFKGQPPKPLFKEGDLVHASPVPLPNPNPNPTKATATATISASPFSLASPFNPLNTSTSTSTTTPANIHNTTTPPTIHNTIATPFSSGLPLPPSTLYRISSTMAAPTDQLPHLYTLQLAEPGTIEHSVPESHLVRAAGFQVGQIVVYRDELYQVRERKVGVVKVRVRGVIGYADEVGFTRFRERARVPVLGEREEEEEGGKVVAVLRVVNELGEERELKAEDVREASVEEAMGWFLIAD